MKSRLLKIIGLILGLFLAFGLLRSIVDLWQKGGALDEEEARFAKAKLENEELKQEFKNIQSPDYIEKQARDKLGLGRENESVVILPPKPTISETEDKARKAEESQAVWQKWVSLLFN